MTASPTPAMVPPQRTPGTKVRVVATNDLLATVAPLGTSTGRTGTLDGVAAFVERERCEGPTIWLDSGDLTGGPLWSLTGQRGWTLLQGLDISATVAGNHELDEGVQKFLAESTALDFPILCADATLGVPGSTLVTTEQYAIGVIGLTNPNLARFAPAPEPVKDPTSIVRAAATHLRADGAQWVLALQHDGVDWWPDGSGATVSSQRWTREARRWSGSVDAVFGGHTFGAWCGSLGAAAVGHAHPFAQSALIVDLAAAGAHSRGVFAIPSDVPPAPQREAAAESIVSASASVVGENLRPLTTVPDRTRVSFLPDMIAKAIRHATAADAALLFPSGFFTQAPLDGACAFLPAGPVTELDLHRLFPFPDSQIAILRLHGDEFGRLLTTHDTLTTPSNRAGDSEWWNWHRIPAGVDTIVDYPRTVAVTAYSVPLIEHWLDRHIVTAEGCDARNAVQAWFAR